MGFPLLSETRLHQRLIRRRWLSILLVVLVFLVLAIGLSVCYSLGASNDDFSGYEGLMPVSALGDKSPEHWIFLITFAIVAVLLFLLMYLRTGQIDA
jgi:uncharacterized BrkB/YihY/UPF0761 family membrane protein